MQARWEHFTRGDDKKIDLTGVGALRTRCSKYSHISRTFSDHYWDELKYDYGSGRWNDKRYSNTRAICGVKVVAGITGSDDAGIYALKARFCDPYKNDYEKKEQFFHMFVVSDEYRWNLMVITLTVMYYVLLGLVPWKARQEYLTKTHLKKEFGEEHLKATLKEIVNEKQGYIEKKYFIVGHPDNGSGRYTMKAGYKAWLEFNKSLRIYHNF